jgi:putative transposase
MPKNLKRYYGRGDLHFVTFSGYRRIPPLRTTGARDVFVKALGAIRDRYKFSLVGYVVMPEHVHLLLSEPPKSTPSIVEPKSKTPRAKPGTWGTLNSFE